MSSIFCDLDGCLFRHKSNDFLPGAKELLRALVRAGHQIIFTTKRGKKHPDGKPFWKAGHVYSEENTREAIKELAKLFDMKDYQLVLGVESPRLVINDSGASSYNHKTDYEWSDEVIAQIIKTAG